MKDREIVANMTLREKAELLTGGGFFETRALPRLGVRELVLTDGPHGVRKQTTKGDRLGKDGSLPATCFPTASLMACSFDETLGFELGRALGRECKALGADMLLGPGLNLKRDPRCGRNFEYFSEDPFLSGKMAAAYVRGIQSEGVSACLKHFAANDRETRRMTSDSVVDERTLRELYLKGFEIALKEGKPWAVMTSYNQLNGEYTNENEHLLREILRGEWGFDGVVLTDWAGGNDRVKGLKCGSDLEMPACKYSADDLVYAVERGEIPESLLDESALRLLALMEKCKKRESGGLSGEILEEHHALARRCAERSIVLLENDGVLPLSPKAKVLVVGEFAFEPYFQGGGSSLVSPAKAPLSPLRCLKEHSEEVRAACGFTKTGKKKRFQKALRLAREADVVLFFAGPPEIESECVDRETLSVPDVQKKLFSALKRAGKRVVVVLTCGSVLETDCFEGCAAAVYAGLFGQAGGEALADILYGKVSPSGKLAQSWAATLKEYPTSAPSLFPGGKDRVEYREGVFVGYRYFATAGVRPKYPFGHGIGYTSYRYDDISVSEKEVSFTVENVGERAGEEICEVYVSKEESALVRPKRALIGFTRVPLAPGEKKKVSVPLSEDAFLSYDTEKKKMRREEGTYLLSVGASSEDIRLSASLRLEGEILPSEREKFPAYAACRVGEIPDKEFEERLCRPLGREREEKRIQVGENTCVRDLKRARGFCGRLLGFVLCTVVAGVYRLQGKPRTHTDGMTEQPIRGLAKFGGMSRIRMEGLIALSNGHFFKGLKMLLRREE